MQCCGYLTVFVEPVAVGLYLAIHGPDPDWVLLLAVLDAGGARQLPAVLRQHRPVQHLGVALGPENQSRLHRLVTILLTALDGPAGNMFRAQF